MTRLLKRFLILTLLTSLVISANAYAQNSQVDSDVKTEKKKKRKKKKRKKKVKLPKIDLSHWKVTLPASNEKGKPYEISPPEIKDFASNEVAKPYMYIDSTRGAIVFHAMPTASKTRNTKFTRSPPPDECQCLRHALHGNPRSRTHAKHK
ncbi:MAG: polysaccharide lyase family 7 protein, partial [Bacteroidota bacterium]